ncbi:unnamed protein product [Polarella glacialis]|uniref:Uncharacterized protein n=1 Tax=Polarella glacialis TaxID=89957 RepID=A0A813DI64_POLGL|nr:unnamed protein product [Polarella glacialis]CAE8690264.1 unnamed protein product [Polarella glacialis]|mmetsp:Transcript_101413/g.183019  ORF Transcript_101413/g.183019 Transcript_101413/m.183019 type:complete len:137 (+) Transcript_101413:95-505(+)|eukprot:CAMPEP_0115125004 /NCGR_PEP_ID=MMETSP0227-20121206/48732_1 /TAXON_ID=89957 /ORGANISM="Polarella glacialis, Strain CCMP 1383" /LENGTH=136 /DNA_ID=CAMNT_0002528189 /DNA_START=24 /DNA_END=434 /DNA_ORIENTATION=+
MAIITVSAPMYISPDQEGKAYKETFCKTGRYFGKEAALFLSDLSHESHTDEALSDVSTLAGSSGFHSASSSQAGDDQSDSSSEADDSDQGIFAFEEEAGSFELAVGEGPACDQFGMDIFEGSQKSLTLRDIFFVEA